MPHREGIREYLKDVEVSGIVIDWGCGTKKIQNYLKPNEADFITIDKLNHVGAMHVVDMETNLGSSYGHADFAFCLEVLEHCWDSKQLIKNIYNNLKSGGVLYLSQPFMYQVHKEDDVHRYTHHGLERLLTENGFIVEEIAATGGTLDKAWGYVLRARKV